MSSGVNIKVISQRQSDAGVSSNLPLPRSLMPSSKMDPKQHRGLSNPTVQHQHANKGGLTYSSSSVSSGPTDLLRGAALKNYLLQQRAGIYSHKSPAASARTDGTCSAYSSPQIAKREAPRSKDTLDLRTSTLTHKALRDLQLRRNVNKNWTFGKYRMRSMDNADPDDSCRLSSNVQGRGHLLYNKGANGNEISGINFQKEMRNISYRELASEVEVLRDKSKSYQTFNMSRRRSEPGKVNMAAVAPFRFR